MKYRWWPLIIIADNAINRVLLSISILYHHSVVVIKKRLSSKRDHYKVVSTVKSRLRYNISFPAHAHDVIYK